MADLMQRAATAACSLTLLALTGSAFGQAWVVYEDETNDRVVADSGLVVNDFQEKDYAWGDFDLDGDTDLAVARKQPFTSAGKFPNVLLMNEGGVLVDRTTEFASASTVPGDQGFLTPTNDRDIFAVDVDLDGWLDLVTGPTYSNGQKHITHPRVYMNLGVDGNGDWLGFLFDNDRIPNMSNVAGPNGCHIDAGDCTGDGWPDLWFVNYNNAAGSNAPADLTNAKLLVNDGTGHFVDETSARLTSSMVSTGFGASGYMVDLNGDGVLDLTKQSAGSSDQIYNNPANEGVFMTQKNLIGGAVYFTNWSDLNNDGLPDFIISDDGADKFMLNTGNDGQGFATFQTKTYQYTGGGFDDGFSGNSIAADLNNDGFKDVLITDVDIDIPGCNRRMHIYRNQGNTPSITLSEQTIGGKVANIATNDLKGVHDVAPIDINGDGWLDLVVGRCSGTDIYINVPPSGGSFSFVGGVPGTVAPGEATPITVEIVTFGGAEVVDGSVTLHSKVDDGEVVSVAMTPAEGANIFTGLLDGADCASTIGFQVTAELTTIGTITDPAPGIFNEILVSLGTDVEIQNFEKGAPGWTVINDPSLTAGAWEVADPVGSGWLGQAAAPADDAQGNQDGDFAFVTMNGITDAPASSFDVDNGPTILVSPVIDIAGTDAVISYARWHFTSDQGNKEEDLLVTEVTNDGGDSWVFVDETSGTTGAWEIVNFKVSDFVEPTDQVQVRFVVADPENSSITESGIDVFTVSRIICDDTPVCTGDIDGDGSVNSVDLNALLGAFGLNADGDLDNDGDTDSADLNILLFAFGTDC